MPIQCTCFTCGTTFLRKPYHIARGSKRMYCSHPCRAAIGPVDPPVVRPDGTAVITLRNRDWQIVGHTIVDADDAEFIGRRGWRLSPDGYAQGTKDRRINLLHRELLGLTLGDGLEGDHINRDRLDNRRSNLRIVTRDQNAQNKGSLSGSSSVYRGVHLRKNGRWLASVGAKDGMHHIGVFDTEMEAAEAARQARIALLPYAID